MTIKYEECVCGLIYGTTWEEKIKSERHGPWRGMPSDRNRGKYIDAAEKKCVRI